MYRFLGRLYSRSHFARTIRFLRAQGVMWILTLGLILIQSSFQSAHADTLVGAIPGQFGVSPHGAATYSMPISVAPGTAGMQPDLSIAYNSAQREGILGLGFSIQGLGAVERCARREDLDGEHGSVNFDSNDRFCLNGERLILVSGDYDSPAAEYR
ncbi:hypothetical protein MK280_19640, partial [Myxococcota bacterium]|nr:hypothetical protein [Myxococcota bacterium]